MHHLLTKAGSGVALERRADIDGLRALAILGVLVFHLDPRWLSGGFLGVDVFFVISGFLITGNIVRGFEEGTWSFAGFIGGRVLRLFPALLVTVAATFVASGWLFTPDLFKEMARSAQASTVWVSNILFWTQAGYFDTDALFKPLLHTWSLSVEEQFYVGWPFLLLVGWKLRGRTGVISALAALGLMSFIAVLAFSERQPEAVFFLTPFRIFEFAIGAGALFLRAVRVPGPRVLAVILGVALAGLGSSYALLDGQTGVAVASLPACLCTAGLLLWGDRLESLSATLGSTPFTLLGRISYSVYLVHWPIIVIYRYLAITEISVVEKLSLAAASLITGAILHRLVERPFDRYRKQVRRGAVVLAIPAALAASLAMVAIASPMVVMDGWTWRYPAEAMPLIKFNRERERKATWRAIDRPEATPKAGEQIDILVVGDSHAKDLFNAIELNRQELEARFGYFTLRGWTKNRACEGLGGDARRHCNLDYAPLFTSGVLPTAKAILISELWSGNEVEHVAGVIARIRQASGARIMLATNAVTFKDIPSLLLRRYRSGPPMDWVQDYISAEAAQYDATLAGIARDSGAMLLDKASIQCPGGHCAVAGPDGKPMLFDTTHWTIAGAHFFGHAMVDRGVLDPLFEDAR